MRDGQRLLTFQAHNMNRIVALVAVLAITASEHISADSKTDPSTLNEEYYLGSGSDRTKHSQNHREKELDLTEEENEIVQDVYSPDYYEPNIILDFRYMKSGGRGYARSDGGQILILPKRPHMPSIYNNYDTLIEYLRLKRLEESNRHVLFESNRDNYRSKGQLNKQHEDELSDAERGWYNYRN